MVPDGGVPVAGRRARPQRRSSRGQSAVVSGRGSAPESALRVAEGRAVDGDGVAAMADSAEECIDHGFVPEDAVPLFVLKVLS